MRHGFRMSVGAHPGGVGEVNAALAEFADANALSADVRRSLNVAIDELLANALSHGRAGRDGQLMDKVSYQRRDDHNVVVLVKQLVNG